MVDEVQFEVIESSKGARITRKGRRGVLDVARWVWTKQRGEAAVMFAQGWLVREVAAKLGISERQIKRWRRTVEFGQEVDRLSTMVDVASRAERLRLAARVARQAIKDDGTIETNADLLDWLKFAQSETDGVKLDLTSMLASFTANGSPVAGSGPEGAITVEGVIEPDEED
jgi:transposase-like protein